VLLLLQRDESGRVGSTDAGPTVLHGLVRDRELAQIVSNHLRLDLDLIEGLPVVDADNGAGHLWNHDHVAEVGLHHVRLLIGRRLLLFLTQLLYQSHRLPFETAGEFPPNPAGSVVEPEPEEP
jgi:hypothetical protein